MPRKAKTETIVTENMEPKEEQIQMPDTPEPADGAPKEAVLEIEESAEKPENTDDMDGVPAMEISDAGAPEQTEENIQRSAPARNRPASPAPPRRQAPSSILTLSTDSEVETQESREDIIWHELQNAYRTRKILTGNLGGIERMEGGGTIAVIYYKEMRVVIPLAEMMINLVEDESHDYGELVLRQNKILGNMLGCEIDFIVNES